MARQDWLEIPEHLQQKWGWLEYRVTIVCACGNEMEIWDGDIVEKDDEYFTCECGRTYTIDLFYREAMELEKKLP